MRALQSLAVKNNVEASDLGVFLDVPEELQEGHGARQRLDDSRSAAYYPRLIVTDADRDQDDCGPESTAIGERGVVAAPSSGFP